MVVALMVVAELGARAWTPTRYLADTRAKVDLEATFPKAFGDWRVDDRMPVQLIAPDLQAFLNKIYNQTLSRTYVNSAGDRVMLAVAYGGDQSDGTEAHFPEICYPAQGFQILSQSRSEISAGQRPIPVVQLTAKLGTRTEPVTYWLVVGDRIALTGTEQKLAQLSYTLRGVIADGMLVRASTIDSNPVRGYKVQEAFLSELVRSLPAPSREFVVGTGH